MRRELSFTAYGRVPEALGWSVPECNAGVKHGSAGFPPEQEAGAEVVAVASIVRIVISEIVEANAIHILFHRVCIERVKIHEQVAAARKLQARLHVRNAHVRERVVARFDEYANGAGPAVADDVHVRYVAVGRIAVRAVLDVQTDKHVLHRDAAHSRLASRIDGDAFRDATPVDDAARKRIDAPWRTNVVRRMYSAQPYHRLRVRLLKR